MPAKSSRKWYVVWRGRAPGVYASWDECKAQVDHFADAIFKSFPTRAKADAAFRSPPAKQAKPGAPRPTAKPAPAPNGLRRVGHPIAESYCVDAACSGNPGRLEYRCVQTGSGREVFRQGPFEHGTNNIGEFLAIVHALALFREQGIVAPVYSDSENALKWLRAKKCKTTLTPNTRNAELFATIERAEKWLADNIQANRVLKWRTEVWGENPADFGRK
jgi:ribonuclease HI